MKIRLEKWYLDFTSEEETGFYYIMCLTFGRFRIGFTGINHFDSSRSIQSFKFLRTKQLSFHELILSKARLTTNVRTAHLQIDHGKTALRGTWKFLHPPLKRQRKPLFRNQTGWCDWKVWTPLAEVDLELHNGEKSKTLKGTGYIDFVRSSLPFWKSPFHSLYWGRMHSPESWNIFLSLQSPEESISMYLDPQTTEREVCVDLKRDELGKAKNMSWLVGESDRRFAFEGNVSRTLETEDILSRKQALRFLPKNIRKKLCSSARDEKYEMISRFRNQKYHGIMEEVKWHGQ